MKRGPESLTGQEAPPSDKDEMNLAEFPIALLTDRIPRGQKTIESQDEFFDERTSKVIVRRRVITGSDKYGLPTVKDDEVILALIQLTKEANHFTERTVNFSRSELIERLHWPQTGQSYRRLARSFDRWLTVGLIYERAWWDNKHKSWVDEKFHIIDRVSLYDGEEQARQPFLKLSSFTWNEVIFRSFESGYIKSFDIEFYLSLKHPTAKRMYRFLDKRFYLKPHWEFDLGDFALNHIGLGRTYEGNTQLARKLQPGIEELEARGFLEPLTERARFKKLSRGEWRIIFSHRQTKAIAELTPPAPESGSTGLEKRLTELGVTASAARELVASYPAERITAQAEHAEFVREKHPKKIRDFAAYLVDAIKNDYAAPVGFVSRAERAKRAEEARAKLKADAEERRRLEEAKAREREAQAQIATYLDSLSPEALSQLGAAALEAASPEMRESYHRQPPSFKRLYLRSVCEAHVRALLKLPPAPDVVQ